LGFLFSGKLKYKESTSFNSHLNTANIVIWNNEYQLYNENIMK
jgi:hypothetical protein